MMPDNCTAKKLLLVIALISLIGVGVGRVSEDLVPASISYADDPATPVVSGALALPAAAESQKTAIVPPRDDADRVRPIAVKTPAGRDSCFRPPAAAFTPPQRC